MIFILPSSPRVLVERLLQRKSESPAALLERLERAMYELGATPIFDRVVRNDVLEDAVNDVLRIVDEGGGWRREQGDIRWFEAFASGLQQERQRLYDALHGG
jgi:guanylate kinase